VAKHKNGGARAEAQVLRALRAQVTRDEIVLTSVRISDPRDGDVEIDIIVLFPDLGAAIIEVKGGLVEYRDGQWTTSRGKYQRRIHPVEQARKGKHALRRYLDRQHEWTGPLLRSAWFVAMPSTNVTGDMGPEGNREHLIGPDDIDRIREQLRRVLGSPLNAEPLPSAGWEHDALALLLRSHNAPAPRRQRTRTVIIAVAGALVGLGGLAWWLAIGTPEAPADTVTVPSEAQCHPSYEPCLPVVEDLNCSDVRMAITVTGDEDPYSLDRDGDGRGCELYR